MSVTAMAQLASKPTRRAPVDKEAATEKYLRLIATYIPSEALAVYLFLLGLLVPAVGTPAHQVLTVKIIVLAAGLALAVLLVFLGFKPGTEDTPAQARRKRTLLVAFAAVALIAYSLATPGGPWGGRLLGIAVSVWGAGFVAILGAARTAASVVTQ